MIEVRGRGRPSKYGYARTSSERNLERRGLMTAVLDAAEEWGRSYGARGDEIGRARFGVAQDRLDEAVGAWLAYRGKR